jgi:hypothetical protein
MKKILLSSILSLALFVVSAQTGLYPCVKDYKLNNGGGCASTFQGLTLTGRVILTFESDVDPNNIPKILGASDVSDPNNPPISILDVIFGEGTITKSDEVSYCYYSGPANLHNLQGAGKKYVFTVKYNGPGNVEVACGGEEITLPVKFSSFTATRSNASAVSVTWTTAQEQNSKGFYVQKNVNGTWTNVAFVFSQAQDGNSTSSLNYSYTDANTEKGITQYRIQQVDLDGRVGYSDIKAIRGDGNLAKVVVYPNPSTDGKLNIVFEDNSALRDVIVNDMQGKAIRSFRGISNNILVIDKLTTGFYTIKVTNRTTNASSVHKVIIK